MHQLGSHPQLWWVPVQPAINNNHVFPKTKNRCCIINTNLVNIPHNNKQYALLRWAFVQPTDSIAYEDATQIRHRNQLCCNYLNCSEILLLQELLQTFAILDTPNKACSSVEVHGCELLRNRSLLLLTLALWWKLLSAENKPKLYYSSFWTMRKEIRKRSETKAPRVDYS